MNEINERTLTDTKLKGMSLDTLRCILEACKENNDIICTLTYQRLKIEYTRRLQALQEV